MSDATQGFDRLLTVAEVAELLAVDPESVRKWIRDGRLPSVRISRLRRVPRSAVDRVARQGLPHPAAARTAAGAAAEG
ncbi:MAG: helix-turn-helix domain-containing protein [Myxococcota bacterium]|jgi:excisionase family DNA binding protein|nr:helix-turn-helix domain-containing protein [Myxococcota bacterium]